MLVTTLWASSTPLLEVFRAKPSGSKGIYTSRTWAKKDRPNISTTNNGKCERGYIEKPNSLLTGALNGLVSSTVTSCIFPLNRYLTLNFLVSPIHGSCEFQAHPQSASSIIMVFSLLLPFFTLLFFFGPARQLFGTQKTYIEPNDVMFSLASRNIQPSILNKRLHGDRHIDNFFFPFSSSFLIHLFRNDDTTVGE